MKPMVGRAGLEPAYAERGRFTVCWFNQFTHLPNKLSKVKFEQREKSKKKETLFQSIFSFELKENSKKKETLFQSIFSFELKEKIKKKGNSFLRYCGKLKFIKCYLTT